MNYVKIYARNTSSIASTSPLGILRDKRRNLHLIQEGGKHQGEDCESQASTSDQRNVQIWGNFKDFYHTLVMLWGNHKVLGQNIHPWTLYSWIG